MEVFFIKVTDAITNKEMIIRGDHIFKIEECEKMQDNQLLKFRLITFINGESEYVTDTMDDLIKALSEE